MCYTFSQWKWNVTVHVVHGKGSKECMTYITPLAMEHLRKYLASRKEHGNALFYNKNHEPLGADGVRFILNRLAERADVKNVHPHRFRKIFASNLFEAWYGDSRNPEINGTRKHKHNNDVHLYR